MEIKNAIMAVDNKAQYDEQVKRLIGQKIILAHILVKVVDEFKGMDPKDVVELIEGEPYIGIIPVEPGLINVDKEEEGKRVIGFNSENVEINEGLVRFDIVFYVRMKDGISQIIINVEAQKDVPTKYKILNRAIFYVCRLVSSQKERDFVKSNYDDIKRVFSIWICMNMDEDSIEYVHLTGDKILGSYTWDGEMNLLNIILIGLSDELPKHDEKHELHRLLGALLSIHLTGTEKLNIIEKEYKISVNEDMRKDVSIMCNLSQGIEDNANAKVIMNMYRKGYTYEQIAEIVEKSIEEVEVIVKKRETVLI